MDLSDDPFGHLDATPSESVDVSGLPEVTEAEEVIEPAFSNVVDFVEQYLVPVTQVQLSAQSGSGALWDPRWWRHTGVVARLTALWQAWEGLRIADDPQAMSSWWLHHYDPHMRVLMGESGPMSGAPDDAWAGHPTLPTQPAPAELFE